MYLEAVVIVLFICSVIYVWQNARYVPRSYLIVGGIATILLGFWPLFILAAVIYFAKQKAIRDRNNQDWERR